jgi:aryl-alcohol dehydrogenase-like predicted oxidoreductase
LLTGKYRRGEAAPDGSRLQTMVGNVRDRSFDALEQLEEFANARGLSVLEVAIGGLAAQPMVGSVIAGASTPAQVQANASAGEWIPTVEDLAAIDAIVPRGSRA